MKKFFNWVIVLAACVGAFYCVGLIVPRSRAMSSKTNLVAKPDRLYAAVADLSTWREWHPDVASVQERPKQDDHPVWRVTEKDGVSYDVEVTNFEEPGHWEATYTIDGSRYTLRYDFGWYGEGGRVRVKRTVDTRDTWKRAKAFLWSRTETAPVGVLNALAEHMGEPGLAKED